MSKKLSAALVAASFIFSHAAFAGDVKEMKKDVTEQETTEEQQEMNAKAKPDTKTEVKK